MSRDHDLIIVGGGLAGASLARVMAAAGSRVLVLERHRAFKDRVRGEQMYPWGVAEAKRLGLLDVLLPAIAREVKLWTNHVHGAPPARARDLTTTSPHRVGSLSFYHPSMQTALLAAAEDAGAEVRRGAGVENVMRGRPATVSSRVGGKLHSDRADLVVGADGRDSAVATWTGFRRHRDPERLRVAGVSLLGMKAPTDRCEVFFRPHLGLMSTVIPVGNDRFRTYLSYDQRSREDRLGGSGSLPLFKQLSRSAGAPGAWFEGAEPGGPLAEFSGADSWIDRPYRDGIVLVGDAAAASDPSFGCGLALTLRDVAALSESLLSSPDPEVAGPAYAARHDGTFSVIHRLVDWLTAMYCVTGPAADALRERAFPKLALEPRRTPDLIGLGPEAPSDEAARRRFFAEDDGHETGAGP